MRKSLRGVFVAISLATIAGACIALARARTSPVKSKAPVRYVRAIYPPATFDPKEANDVSSISVINLIYSGLLEFTPDLGVRGDLAESWRTSADGKALFFTLRRGLTFQNGEPLTTQNVVASLSRLMDRDSRVFSYYESIQGAKAYHEGRAHSVSGLIAASNRDLVIRLNYPFAPFLSILAGATAKVLPIHDSHEQLKDFFKRPVGSGPFQFVRVTSKEITLSRFDNYYGQKPQIAQSEHSFVNRL